ncbi:MAG: peptidyl-prolyl cis-trans isomerase B (cyclophilin B), partial [bacterium]
LWNTFFKKHTTFLYGIIMSNLVAVVDTTQGKIKLNLYPEQAPVTVANFVNLSLRGYYDGLKFHRVIDNFMVQGGCPSGTGTGGPGYRFEDECVSELRHDQGGVLSMANAGPGTNGSQFFITHTETPWLDGKHTVFGKILSDEDQVVINKISQSDSINSITIEGDHTDLLEKSADRIKEWNETLKSNFPNLK